MPKFAQVTTLSRVTAARVNAFARAVEESEHGAAVPRCKNLVWHARRGVVLAAAAHVVAGDASYHHRAWVAWGYVADAAPRLVVPVSPGEAMAGGGIVLLDEAQVAVWDAAKLEMKGSVTETLARRCRHEERLTPCRRTFSSWSTARAPPALH